MKLLVLIGIGILVGVGIVYLEPYSFWALPAALLVGLCLVLNPLWMICLLLALPPFRVVWVMGGIAPLELAYSLTFLSLLAKVLLKAGVTTPSHQAEAGFRSPMRTSLVLFLILAAFSAVQAVLQGVPFVFWASHLNMILFYAFYFVIVGQIKDPKEIDRLLIALSWITLVAVIFRSYPHVQARGFTVTLYGEEVIKVAGASAFGLTMFLILLSILLCVPQRNGKWVSFLFLCFFFGLHQLFAAVRSRWLGGLAAILLILLIVSPQKKAPLLRFFFLLLLSVSLLLTVSLTVPIFSENPALRFTRLLQRRFATIFKGSEDPTTQVRFVEWEAAMKKAKDRLWLGNGLGTEITFIDTTLMRPQLVARRYIHNSYVFYLLNMGLAGLCTFLWLSISFVIYGVKVFHSITDDYYKGVVLGCWASFVAMAVAAFAGASLNDPALTIWAGFLMGVVTVIDKRRALLGGTNP